MRSNACTSRKRSARSHFTPSKPKSIKRNRLVLMRTNRVPQECMRDDHAHELGTTARLDTTRLGVCLKDMRRPEIKKNRARQYAPPQKTSARPAFGECGKQTLQGPKHLYLLTISTCFRPKKRASTDQAPGPIIAKLRPKPQTMIAVHGSAALAKASHSCVTATRSPTYGVPNPITRRTDAINGSATSAE